MRTARTEHGRPHGKRRKFQSFLPAGGKAQERCGSSLDAVYGIFSGSLHVARELAPDLYIQVMLAAEIDQLPLDDGVQFFQTEDFVQTVQKLQRQFFRERERRTHLQQAGAAQGFAGFQRIGIADAARCKSFADICHLS